MSAHSCAAGFVYISAWLRTFSLDLHFAFLVNTLFLRMGLISRLINESSKRCLKRALLAKLAVPSVHFFIVLVDGLKELLIGIIFTNFCEESWTGVQDYKGRRSAHNPVLGEENAFG